MSNPLEDLSEAGVSVWLDDISRTRLRTGNLTELMSTHKVVGVTSNPSIFDKALAEGDAYDEQVSELAARGVSVEEAVRLLTAYDIRWA
ncbi:transaldolase family protein, partial [Nocardiopsis tropica]|nr:transaldolase family protein [Nocardiopsis tropica]